MTDSDIDPNVIPDILLAIEMSTSDANRPSLLCRGTLFADRYDNRDTVHSPHTVKRDHPPCTILGAIWWVTTY
jgi:hypothetical protein